MKKLTEKQLEKYERKHPIKLRELSKEEVEKLIQEREEMLKELEKRLYPISHPTQEDLNFKVY